MKAYEIIVTDVTCYRDLYCVAGWDRLAGGMIRPEPPGSNTKNEASRFWEKRIIENFFSIGNIVRFYAKPPHPGFLFPHASEDRILDETRPIELLKQLSPAQTVQAATASVSLTLDAAFDGALVKTASRKAYVPIGYMGKSLGAIEIAPHQIVFHENSYDADRPKLRACITVDDNIYDLSVPADAARLRWKIAGLEALQADAQKSTRIHARIGLSRPFPAMPNECYAQINGLYFL